MNVLFLIGGLSVQDGGTARELISLTEMIVKKRGINVTIACITPKQESIKLDSNINYIHFNHLKKPGLSWFRDFRELKNLIRLNDVIISTGIWGPIDGISARLAWRNNKPLYIKICGMLEPYILARNSLKKKIGLLLYVNKNLKKATGLIVQSESEKSNVLNLGINENKIKIIPNGVLAAGISDKASAKAGLGINPKLRVLLYIGRIHPKKGLHKLISAMAQLSSPTSFKLLVAGEFSDNKYKKEILSQIQSSNLAVTIHFSGVVSGEEKDKHFHAADCFILPSESEGLPVAVLEALAHGIPSIVTTWCNVPEIETYKAGLVIASSVNSIKTGLEWFLAESKEFQAASVNAMRLIKERFDLQKSVNTFIKVINITSKTVCANESTLVQSEPIHL